MVGGAVHPRMMTRVRSMHEFAMERPSLADVAVVTVTYHAADFLPAMLEALPLDELAGVVVVDNAGEDALRPIVEHHAARRVELVVPGANIGFGAGCNEGARHAPTSTWLLFLNPDAVLLPADLRAMVDYAAAHPAAAVVGARVFHGDTPLTSAGRLASWSTELRHHGPPLLRALFPERRLPPTEEDGGRVGYVEGCCMLVERSAFDAVGGFDEALFLYYEESDLGRAIERLGREVHLCADARVEHEPGTTRRRGSPTQQAQLLRSATHYIDKWEGPARARVFGWLAHARLLVQLAARRTDRSDYRGVRDGLTRASATPSP